MLSKSKTYDTGINQLSTFLDKYPEFQITQYYLQQEYDHKFIARVLASLESRQKRITRTDDTRHNSNIGVTSSPSSGSDKLINKIRSLKQIYEGNEIRNETRN